ncbi:F-box protein skip16 [Physocladia obscura]|uniref:F-box protein skip16 n=1 Tax=Physocladia obscura TaxID=109957 RepID=A0AAD5T9E7_9FUNG|nr:F-box protein skip16 [Physocladia obscura]
MSNESEQTARKALPQELLLLISGWLDYRHVALLGAVSRGWRLAARDDRVWRRLLADYHVPEPRTGETKSDPLAVFRLHAAAVANLVAEFAFVAPRVASLAARLVAFPLPASPNNPPVQPSNNNANNTPIASLITTMPSTSLAVPQSITYSSSDLKLDYDAPYLPAVKSSMLPEERLLIMMLHLLAAASPPSSTSSVFSPYPEHHVGLFGTNRCYDDVYAMHLVPVSDLKVLVVPAPAGGGSGLVKKIVRFGVAQAGEFLALVIEGTQKKTGVRQLNYLYTHYITGTLSGSIIRYARPSHSTARMGPIPKNHLPFFNLGSFTTWLTAFADSLASNRRRVVKVLSRHARERTLPSIFLDDGPGTGVAVTRGIRVHVATFFMLAMARVCYRIIISMDDCSEEQGDNAVVQLKERRWAFRYLNGRVERVQGDGVIGYFPILSAAKQSFTYCSYSDGGRVIDDIAYYDGDSDEDVLNPYADGRGVLENPVVSLEGVFTFVPGTLQEPLGEAFDVEIPFVEFVRPQIMPCGILND